MVIKTVADFENVYAEVAPIARAAYKAGRGLREYKYLDHKHRLYLDEVARAWHPDIFRWEFRCRFCPARYYTSPQLLWSLSE